MKISANHSIALAIALIASAALSGCDKSSTTKNERAANDATPGQKISITLKNTGTTPKLSMGHNLVVLDRAVNEQNVLKWLDTASSEAAHDYVPRTSKEVLAHTKLLGPGETDTITFNAPQIPGSYLYVCSFPGHYSQGTKGIMTVK